MCTYRIFRFCGTCRRNSIAEAAAAVEAKAAAVAGTVAAMTVVSTAAAEFIRA